MVAGPAVMAAAAAANQKRQLGGPGGQLQAPGVPKRPRMMSQYRVPESGDPMRLGNPVQVRRGIEEFSEYICKVDLFQFSYYLAIHVQYLIIL